MGARGSTFWAHAADGTVRQYSTRGHTFTQEAQFSGDPDARAFETAADGLLTVRVVDDEVTLRRAESNGTTSVWATDCEDRYPEVFATSDVIMLQCGTGDRRETETAWDARSGAQLWQNTTPPYVHRSEGNAFLASARSDGGLPLSRLLDPRTHEVIREVGAISWLPGGWVRHDPRTGRVLGVGAAGHPDLDRWPGTPIGFGRNVLWSVDRGGLIATDLERHVERRRVCVPAGYHVSVVWERVLLTGAEEGDALVLDGDVFRRPEGLLTPFHVEFGDLDHAVLLWAEDPSGGRSPWFVMWLDSEAE
jgi:hypothetical protein